jgi:PTS system mannose-specific IIA component
MIFAVKNIRKYKYRRVYTLIALIIGTHGKFSEELIKSSELIYGKQTNIASITFEAGESIENLISKYKKVLKELNTTDGALFLVDLFGGSPYNAAIVLANENVKMDVITGVNLPMLIEAYARRTSDDIDDLVKHLKEASKLGIRNFKESKNYCEEEL